MFEGSSARDLIADVTDLTDVEVRGERSGLGIIDD